MEQLAHAGPVHARATRFRDQLRAAFRRDRALYVIALTVLVVGYGMQPITGNRPDWAIVLRLGGRMLLIGNAIGFVVLAWRLIWLALVARSRTPTRDLLDWVGSFFRGEGLAANAVHTTALFFIFGAGFSVLKGAIAVIEPFRWDTALAEFDRLVHFGRLPHEWLQPVLERPLLVYGVNFVYNLWFLVVVGAFVACACATRRSALRHQYLMSFMLVWFVGGFFIATGFSSAGPCYYARIGLGDLYAPLMEQLRAAATRFPVWAVEGQDALWQGYVGSRPGSAGISAFPSMHVATATLVALALPRIQPWLLPVGLAYWALIMLGSVLLGWHYAADGYAATLIAVAIWCIAGLYGRRTAAERSPVEP